jgi:thymidylate synthase
LTQIIAQETDLNPGYFAHTIIDAHIYVGDKGSENERYDHLDGLKEQLNREPLPLPKLIIKKKPLSELTFEDFELVDYQYHPKIKFEVAV